MCGSGNNYTKIWWPSTQSSAILWSNQIRLTMWTLSLTPCSLLFRQCSTGDFICPTSSSFSLHMVVICCSTFALHTRWYPAATPSHPRPSLTHSQCLSMNGSDIMNNSRRTGRPISYWSFQPPPSCAAAVCHGWRRICLAMDWMVQQTGHTGRQWIYYSGYSLLLLRQYLHSDIIVSDLPVSTFSSAGQSCVAHQLLCRLVCMQYLTP